MLRKRVESIYALVTFANSGATMCSLAPMFVTGCRLVSPKSRLLPRECSAHCSQRATADACPSANSHAQDWAGVLDAIGEYGVYHRVRDALDALAQRGVHLGAVRECERSST